MTPVTQLLESDAVRRTGWVLLHALWQAAAVAAGLWVALAYLRRRGPGARYAAACGAMALMVAGPLLTLRLLPVARPSVAVAVISPNRPAFETTPLAADVKREIILVADAAPAAITAVVSREMRNEPSAREATPTPTHDSPRWLTAAAAWLPWGVVFWLTGVIALTLWNVGGWVAVQRLQRRATADAGADLACRAAAVARRMNVTQPVRLAATPWVDVPAVVGWVRPTLLVPAPVAGGLPAAHLDAILAHEFAHVRRHDYLVNLFQCAAETLLFFHPAVWWASGRVRLERELCCDDAAVAACGDRVGYADALASLERWRGVAPPALAAAGPRGGRAGAGVLLARVRRVLGVSPDDVTRPRPAAGFGFAALAAAAALLCCAMPHVPLRTAAAAEPDTRPMMRAPTTAPVIGSVYGGRVLSPMGEPVAGATVSLVEQPEADSRIILSTTRTAADGSFRLPSTRPTAAEPYPGYVMIEAEGYGLAGGSVMPLGPGQVKGTEFRFGPPTALHVRFVGWDDKPITGLRVEVQKLFLRRELGMNRTPQLILIPSGAREQQTDADGKCVFAGLTREASAQLGISDSRFARLIAQDAIILHKEAVTDAKPIRLQAAGSIRGRVTYEDSGKPAGGVCITATTLNGDNRSWGVAISDERGEYHIKQLAPASYHLTARLGRVLEKDWTAATIGKVAVAAGETVEGEDFALIKGGVIQGQVVREDTRQGVPNFSVRMDDSAGLRTGGVQDKRTDTDGRFMFRVPPGRQHVYASQRPPEGCLEAEPKSHEPEVAAGQTVAIKFVLPRDPSPPVAGRVLDADGNSVGRATVTAELPIGGDLSARSTLSDQDGRFQFVAIPAGSRMHASKDDRATTQPVRTQGREDNLTLRLEKENKASLLVSVVDTAGKPIGGAGISLTIWSGRFGSSVPNPNQLTDTKGHYLLEHLPVVGQYHVSADADGYGPSETLVPPLTPGQQTALERLVLKQADQVISGRVTDKDGQPKAGIRVCINGSWNSTGSKETIADADGRFRFPVVAGAKTILFLRDEDGSIIDDRSVEAGTTDIKLLYRSPSLSQPNPAR